MNLHLYVNLYAERVMKQHQQGHATTIPKQPLASTIQYEIQRRGITQVAAAEIIDEAPSQVSLLSSNLLRGFSSDRLVRMLTRLGYDVELRVTKVSGRRQGRIRVHTPAPRRTAAS